jgi:WD40 repeat protein
LWHDLELIHIIHNAHTAAVRCIEVDLHNELFISGGKDGLILFLKVEESKLSPFNRVELRQVHSNNLIEEEGHLESFKIEFQVQSLAPNPSLESEEY